MRDLIFDPYKYKTLKAIEQMMQEEGVDEFGDKSSYLKVGVYKNSIIAYSLQIPSPEDNLKEETIVNGRIVDVFPADFSLYTIAQYVQRNYSKLPEKEPKVEGEECEKAKKIFEQRYREIADTFKIGISFPDIADIQKIPENLIRHEISYPVAGKAFVCLDGMMVRGNVPIEDAMERAFAFYAAKEQYQDRPDILGRIKMVYPSNRKEMKRPNASPKFQGYSR